jgi:hypothetical protein
MRTLDQEKPVLMRTISTSMLIAAVAGAQVPSLTREFTIGCAECGDARQFASIQEVALLADGRVLVADRDAPMLRLFGTDGAPLWAKGRRGAGPGEYQYVIRVAPAPSGELLIADMSGRRLTTLSAAGDVLGTAPITVFVTTAGTDGRGALLLGGELPMGGLRLFRARGAAVEPVAFTDPGAAASASGGPAFHGSSVALSPSGVIAVAPSSERYRIIRIDASGAALPELTRAIERVRRTPAEESALRERIGRQMGAMRSALERETGKAASTTAPTPAGGNTDLSLKPHFAVDGLRYDGAGRLWVRTMRGDDSRTIFDLFAASGAFLGSVEMAGPVQLFAFNGRWMVTTGEDADGVPQVTRWRVGVE